MLRYLAAGGVCLLLIAPPLEAYDVILKSGKVLRGELIREDADRVVLEDASGIEITIKTANIDAQKTKDANKPAAAATKTAEAKKKGRVYTKEDLERLREQYDLGEKSFGGEYSKVEFKKTGTEPEVTTSFQADVLESEVPVLVDFWAAWCGPCKQVSPRVDAVGAEFSDRAKIYKVNIDEQPDLARFYNVTSIPTLMCFKDGEVVATIVGAAKQDAIAARTEEVLNKKPKL